MGGTKSMIDYKAQGKRNRANGAIFERRVRTFLEDEGYVVAKWSNNIKDDKCIPAKPGRFRMMQTGFPDFIAFKPSKYSTRRLFIEVKTNGYLSKTEKEKAQWYLKNNYCHSFYVAKKIKNGHRVGIKFIEITREVEK